MPELAVLAEVLAMVGREDNPGVRQQAVGLQAAEKTAELGIQAVEAIIVKVSETATHRLQFELASRSLLGGRGVACLEREPAVFRTGILLLRYGAGPESSFDMGRRKIGSVHIHDIQEEEEGPSRVRCRVGSVGADGI